MASDSPALCASQIQQVVTVLAAFLSVLVLMSQKPYKAASDNKVGA